MTFQWTLAAAMLYFEGAVTFILCIPFISNTRWNKFFKLRLLQQLASGCKVAFYCSVVFQAVLFIDSVKSTMKYQDLASNKELAMHPNAVHENHLLLFRAQRNSYISGFALFLLLVINRLQKLIASNALLSCSSEAFRRQAENASKTAEQFMAENERLKLSNSIAEEINKEPEDSKVPKASEPERFGDSKADLDSIRRRAQGLSGYPKESDDIQSAIDEIEQTNDKEESKKDD